MSRTPLIAGNWKMFKTGPEAVAAATSLAGLASDVADTDIMIAPAFLSLPLVSEAVAGSNVKLGVQNLFYENEGAYTGEVSAAMVKAAGADYAIIGHSERRQYFGETDDAVCRKVKASIDGGIIPILCIGETEVQREDGKTFSVLDKQISNGLNNFCSRDLSSLVIAYEPVWAIGTGKTATPDQVAEIHGNIRSLINKLFGNELAMSIRILYGGSVKPDNVSELMSLGDVDGALVGGASLDAETFIQIIRYDK
ncbi:MAG: triose-phosphate isomerase [Desulfobacteraceae bacterium]|nr:triose-phosphate isomerase [Desulfobacteraceae bacterium]